MDPVVAILLGSFVCLVRVWIIFDALTWRGAILLLLDSGEIRRPEWSNWGFGWIIEPHERIKGFVITGNKKQVMMSVKTSLHEENAFPIGPRQVGFEVVEHQDKALITLLEQPPTYDRLLKVSICIETPEGVLSAIQNCRRRRIVPKYFTATVRKPYWSI